MKCQEVSELLVAYLDGEVTPSERTLIQAHLAECNFCRKELTALSATQRCVSQSLQVKTAQAAPSPQAWSRLQARLAGEARPSLSWLPTWLQRLAPGVGRTTQIFQGGLTMKKGFAALAAIALVVVLTAGAARYWYPQVVVLEPIHQGEEGWAVDWVEPSAVNQGDAVNGIVRGPSGETDYRCVVLLEPIQPGEQFSKASEPVCSRGAIDSINGVSLDSSYLIARFYDRTNYTTLLVEYYGSSACSPTISYGIPDLPDNLDNKFASGRAYSNCDHIYVYDFNNYGGPSYSCGANCSSFYALNDEVSSWRTTD